MCNYCVRVLVDVNDIVNAVCLEFCTVQYSAYVVSLPSFTVTEN